MGIKILAVYAVIGILFTAMPIPVNGADFNFLGTWRQVEDPDTFKTIKEASKGIFTVIGYNKAANWETHGIGIITSKGFLIWSHVNDGNGEAGFGTLKPMKNNQYSQETYNTDGSKRSTNTYTRSK